MTCGSIRKSNSCFRPREFVGGTPTQHEPELSVPCWVGVNLRGVSRVIVAERVRLESRLLPLGVRHRVCFAGEGMTSLPGLRATFRALDIDCVHGLSLPEVFFGNIKARRVSSTAIIPSKHSSSTSMHLSRLQAPSSAAGLPSLAEIAAR